LADLPAPIGPDDFCTNSEEVVPQQAASLERGNLTNAETALTSISKSLLPRGRRSPPIDLEGVRHCEVAHRPVDYDMPSSAFLERGGTCRSLI